MVETTARTLPVTVAALLVRVDRTPPARKKGKPSRRSKVRPGRFEYLSAPPFIDNITGRLYSVSERAALGQFLRHVGKAPKKQRAAWCSDTQATWEAFASAIYLCDVNFPPSALSALRSWVTITVVGCGMALVAKVLKAFANHLRSRAASHDRKSLPAEVRQYAEVSPLHPSSPECLTRLLTRLDKIRSLPRRVRNELQLTAFSRALPYPGGKEAVEALKSHRSVLASPHGVPGPDRLALKVWATRWGKRYGRFAASDVARMQASSSATLDVSRFWGGARTDLRDRVNAWFEEEPGVPSNPADRLNLFPTFADPSRFTETGESNRAAMGHAATRGSVEYVVDISADPDGERRRVAQIIRDCSLRSAADALAGGPLPECEAATIKERGFKTRIVTKSPIWLVEAGHLVRSVVWPMLERDPRIKASLSGERLVGLFRDLREDPVEAPLGLGDPLLVSADLTKATDGLSQAAIAAVWEGVCDGAGLPDDVRRLGRLVLGPQVVRYTELEEATGKEEGELTITSVRGCLMGLPLSWFILNLVNLWAAEDSVAEVQRSQGIPIKPFGAFRLAVCGDDLAGVLPALSHCGYERRIRAVGSGLSAGKHLVSHHLLLFTEQMAWFEHIKVPAPDWALLGRLKPGSVVSAELDLFRMDASFLVDYVPVRSIVHPGHFETKRASPFCYEMPTWATSGPAISSSIPAWSSSFTRRRVGRLVTILRPEIRRLECRGIPARVPRALGGGGFPPLRHGRVLQDCRTDYRRFLFRVLLDARESPQGPAVAVLQNLVDSWRTTGVAGDLLSIALEEARAELEADPPWEVPAEVGSRLEKLGSEIPGHRTLTLDDAAVALAAVWAPSLGVAGFADGRPYCRPFDSFAAAFRKKYKLQSHRLTGRGKPLGEVEESALVDRLEELAEGPVVLLSQERVPPGLGVMMSMKGSEPPKEGASWATQVKDLSSRQGGKKKFVSS